MRSGIFREDPGGFAETKAQTIKSCNKDREAGIKEGLRNTLPIIQKAEAEGNSSGMPRYRLQVRRSVSVVIPERSSAKLKRTTETAVRAR